MAVLHVYLCVNVRMCVGLLWLSWVGVTSQHFTDDQIYSAEADGLFCAREITNTRSPFIHSFVHDI